MKNKSPIGYWQSLLGGLLIVLLLTLESSGYVNGQLQVNGDRTLLLLINYLIWSLSIHWIYQYLVVDEITYSNFLKSFLPRFLGLVIAQLLISNFLLYTVKFVVIDQSFGNSMEEFLSVLPRAITSRVIDLCVIVGILKVLDGQKKISAQQLEMSDLQNQLTQTKLDMLQMQLNPHFLFNALHAIHSLIGYDNEKSKKLLLNISNLLRKILELGNQQLIPLSEELEFFKTYLAVEEERFHDRLSTHYDIEPNTMNCQVPSLLLQPLLENALKHGIALVEGTGKISLYTHIDQDQLTIELSNTISPEHTAKTSTGIGLENVANRLDTLFPNRHKLSTEKTATEFSIKISIPSHDI